MRLIVKDCFNSQFKEEYPLTGITLSDAKKEGFKIMDQWCENSIDRVIFNPVENVFKIASKYDGTCMDIYGVLILNA